MYEHHVAQEAWASRSHRKKVTYELVASYIRYTTYHKRKYCILGSEKFCCACRYSVGVSASLPSVTLAWGKYRILHIQFATIEPKRDASPGSEASWLNKRILNIFVIEFRLSHGIGWVRGCTRIFPKWESNKFMYCDVFQIFETMKFAFLEKSDQSLLQKFSS